MNAYQFGSVLLIGILTSIASAAEQQQQDPLSTAAFASTQESAAVQAIRWRVATSCYQNSDCAAHAISGANDRRSLPLQAPPAESPSTPERRRALGLTADPANQR
jgi:hypothetical protein